jgi:hypothetical protein
MTMKVTPRWALAAVLAAGCLHLASAQPASMPVQDGECATQATAGMGMSGAHGRFALGKQDRYQLRFRSDAKYDFTVLLEEKPSAPGKRAAAPSALTQELQVTLAADIEVTVIDHVGAVQRVMLRFIRPDVKISLRGQIDKALSETVNGDLLVPIFVDIESTGRVSGHSVQQGRHNVTQGLVRTVLALSQVVMPEQGDVSKSWATEEDDPNGIFPVRYVPFGTAAKKESTVVRFSKTRYRQTTAQEPSTNSHTMTLAKEFVPMGSMTVTYDIERGRLLSVVGAEKLTSSMNQKQVGQARSDLRLVHRASRCIAMEERSGLVATDSVEAVWKSVRVPLSASIQSAAEDDKTIARSTLGEETWETLLAMLRRVSASDQSGVNETGLYLQLKALANLKPQACEQITDHLLTLSPADRSYRLVVGALSVVGHEQAQASLLRLATQAADDPAALVHLLVSLATVDRPTPDTLALFERYATQDEQGQVAATAQLGLGVMARKLWRYDQPKSDSLVNYFVSQLEASTDVNSQLQWLSVLGNGGTPTEFDVVARQLADPNPIVRSTAINALRWQGDPRVGGMLIKALQDDPNENARSSAARTLEFRKVGAADLSALKLALARDPSARVRNVVLVILWQLRVGYPEVIALVNKTADNDPEESVRKAAKELLKLTMPSRAK